MKTGLSNEKLVALYNSTQNEEYLKELHSKNVGLLNILVKPYVETIPNAEFEDLMSEAWFPMLKAIKEFDPDYGCAFSTLLKTYVKQHMNRIYESATRQKRYTGTTPDSYERLIEVGKDGNVDDRNFTVECEDFKSVEFDELLKSVDFTDKERVIVNILMAGGTNGDCSRELDIKPASVTYYFKQIRKKFVLAGYAI